mmetsp:Transcript_12287/g.28739  ORF Transcript_12287/g.28739 Transcript_12287/m.28739 type:complete len:1091 (-) Transcript_12287:60-3332(-)
MVALAPLAVGLVAALSTSKDVLNTLNGLFSSFVAVTGDAHQAKVALDIFRQEVRYERSLQMREDVRDMEQLMVEGVQAHTFMDSIILGVCFAMLIEGHPPEESDRTLVAVWLVFGTWSVAFTLVGLLLALRFQTKVSTRAQQRLLKRNRFTLPDDLVVGKLGGQNIVGQFSALFNHMLGVMQRMYDMEGDQLGQLKNPTSFCRDKSALLEEKSNGGLDAAEKGLPTLSQQVLQDDAVHRKVREAQASEEGAGTATLSSNGFLAHSLPTTEKTSASKDSKKAVKMPAGSLKVEVDESYYYSPASQPNAEEAAQPDWSGKAVVIDRRTFKNETAWRDCAGNCSRDVNLAPERHRLLDVPFFLMKEMLVRQPYFCSKEMNQRPLNFRVYGKATLYISGLCPPPQGGAGQTFQTQVPRWSTRHLPKIIQKDRDGNELQRGKWRSVDGFTIFVDPNHVELPLYKMVLLEPPRAPAGEEAFVEVQVNWSFDHEGCEALLVFLRKGQIDCAEEEWPIREFQNEIQEITPLREFSSIYMRHGISCLCLSAGLLATARLELLFHSNWIFEVILAFVAFVPALLMTVFLPLDLRILQDDKKAMAAEVEDSRPSVGKPPSIPEEAAEEVEAQDAAASERPHANLVQESPCLPVLPKCAKGQGSQCSEDASTATPSTWSALPWDMLGKCRQSQCTMEAVDMDELVLEQQEATLDAPSAEQKSRSEESPGKGSAVPARVSSHKDRKTTRSASVSMTRSPTIGTRAAQTVSEIQKLPLNWQLKVGVVIVEVLFILSLACAFFPKHVFPEEESSNSPEAEAGHFTETLVGEAWNVTWPPLFRPTAVTFEESSSTLRVASGSTLRAFKEFPHWAASRDVSIFDEAVIGLGFYGGYLHVAGASRIQKVLSLGNATSEPAGTGLLADLSSARHAITGAMYRMPRALSRVTLAAIFEMPFAVDASALPAAIAADGSDLHVCAALGGEVVDGEVGDLHILGSFTAHREVLQGKVLGLHVCPDGLCAKEQPVVWAADATSIAAIGGSSGTLLGWFRLPWWSSDNEATRASVSAVTGNSTHLIITATSASSSPLLWSTPYPTLRSESDDLEL